MPAYVDSEIFYGFNLRNDKHIDTDSKVLYAAQTSLLKNIDIHISKSYGTS